MLNVRELVVRYGEVQALYGVDMEIRDGEVVALIGPNGAGKTTALNAVAAVLPRHGGEVIFDGEPLPPDPVEVVRRGLALVPQGRKVFPSMTVEENLLLGSFSRGGRWRGSEQRFAPVFELFPQLKDRRRQPAGKLSGGEQQMLVIGRAMLSEPKLVMIDELSLGLAPKVVQTLLEMIVRLRNEYGTTFLLVEQAAFVLTISDRAYLLQKGKVAYEGNAKALLNQIDVLHSAYLGAKTEGAPVLRG